MSEALRESHRPAFDRVIMKNARGVWKMNKSKTNAVKGVLLAVILLAVFVIPMLAGSGESAA